MPVPEPGWGPTPHWNTDKLADMGDAELVEVENTVSSPEGSGGTCSVLPPA